MHILGWLYSRRVGHFDLEATALSLEALREGEAAARVAFIQGCHHTQKSVVTTTLLADWFRDAMNMEYGRYPPALPSDSFRLTS